MPIEEISGYPRYKFAQQEGAIVTPKATGEIDASESFSGAERRLSHRFVCDGFAEVFAFDTGFLFRGAIRDLSQTGCCIATKALLKLECQSGVDLLFRLNNHEYRTLARVKVVRPGKGVGLEFLHQDSRVEVSFQTLLQTLRDEAASKYAKAASRQISALAAADNSNPAQMGNLETLNASKSES
jgi:PilZ domain